MMTMEATARKVKCCCKTVIQKMLVKLHLIHVLIMTGLNINLLETFSRYHNCPLNGQTKEAAEHFFWVTQLIMF